jgi:glutamyl-tRNA reductase
LLIGLNHVSAPLEVRERVSFPKTGLADALRALTEQVGEGVILSTCNRAEVYCAVEDTARAAERIRRFIAESHGLKPDAVSPYLYERTDAEAARHLFRVASGLDSMLLGESQVLGQVSDALRAASEAKSIQVPMVGLFHAAVRTGRRVREQTELGRNPLSVSYASVQLAQRVLSTPLKAGLSTSSRGALGSLVGLRALLIGAGEAGQLVAKALRSVGVGELTIANRTLARAEELAQSLGGRAMPFSDIPSALARADIVIAAADSPEFVVTHEMVAAAFLERNERPLFVFDLAVPRDVDPQVADLDGVRLYNIDDLSAIAEENFTKRKQSVGDAEAIVEEELAHFMSWWESLDAIPAIKTLRQQAEAIRQRELSRALRKMPGLPPEHQAVLEAMTRSIVNKLLHDPTLALKQYAGNSQPQELQELFRLWGEE